DELRRGARVQAEVVDDHESGVRAFAHKVLLGGTDSAVRFSLRPTSRCTTAISMRGRAAAFSARAEPSAACEELGAWSVSSSAAATCSAMTTLRCIPPVHPKAIVR